MAGGTIVAILVSGLAIWQSSRQYREAMRDKVFESLEQQLRIDRLREQRLVELSRRTDADTQPLYVILGKHRTAAQSMLSDARGSVSSTTALLEKIAIVGGLRFVSNLKSWRISIAKSHAESQAIDLQIDELAQSIDESIVAFRDGQFTR